MTTVGNVTFARSVSSEDPWNFLIVQTTLANVPANMWSMHKNRATNTYIDVKRNERKIEATRHIPLV